MNLRYGVPRSVVQEESREQVSRSDVSHFLFYQKSVNMNMLLLLSKIFPKELLHYSLFHIAIQH